MSLMGKRFMQPLRLAVLWGFLAFQLYLGICFARFVDQFAGPGAAMPGARPDGIDGFLPIAALVGLRDWYLRGSLNPFHPAAVVVLLTVLAVSLLLKRSFCSWICPVAAVSELLWKRGFSLFRRNLRPPRWLDIGLRGLKLRVELGGQCLMACLGVGQLGVYLVDFSPGSHKLGVQPFHLSCAEL